MKIETQAKLRYLRISPRKVRLLVDLIRGMKAEEAINQLGLSKKHAAKPVMKLLQSAMANAVHNNAVDPSTLVVKHSFVDGGPILYRWMPRAFGRAGKIRKRTSHVTIIVEGEAHEAAPKKKETEGKTEEAAAPKKASAKKTTATKKTSKTSAADKKADEEKK